MSQSHPNPSQPSKSFKQLDGCQLCLGLRGGTPGNENIVNSIVMCDYCTSDYLFRSKRLDT